MRCCSCSKKCIVISVLLLIGLAILLITHFILSKKMSATSFDTLDFSAPFTNKTHDQERFDFIPVKGSDGHLIYVTGSLHADKAIQLDFEDGRPTCVVPLNLTYNSVSGREALTLGNGKVIVRILNNEVSRRSPLSAAVMVEWRVSIIDPNNCTFNHLTVAKSEDRLEGIVAYWDSFDVLLRNLNPAKGPGVTKVVRYNDKAERVDSFSAVIPDQEFLKVQTVKEYDHLKGYYYIVPKKQQGVSTIKRLNSEFVVLNSHEFKHAQYLTYDTNAYSAEHERFSVCYFDKEDRKTLKCLVLNSDLSQVLADISLSYDYDVYHVTVRNLEEGGLVVFYGKKAEEKTYTIYAQHVNAEAKISKPVELGLVPNVITNIYDFELKERSYAVAVTIQDAILTKHIVSSKA